MSENADKGKTAQRDKNLIEMGTLGWGLLLAETKLRSCAEVVGGEVVGEEFGPCGGGDHGGVVGGEAQRWEGDGEAAAVGFGLEAAAELGVGGYSARDDDAVGAEGFGRGKGLSLQVADYGVLEGGNEVEGLLIAEFCYGGGFGGEAGIGG